MLLIATVSITFAANDGFYNLSQTAAAWDGTEENRLKPPTADYTSNFGDESSVTYTLPWPFTFYGQSFNQITADTNGNAWFGNSWPAHSFNLANNGRGPVIAAWNNDLSSYYNNGGVFIQHKTSPERIVIEWQTETYTNEGRRRPNTFETVLFSTGEIRIDYQSFTQDPTNKDFGSGISLNDGTFYVNLTTDKGNVFTLGGQSFLINAVGGSTKTLDVSVIGKGAVTSNVGVSWNASQPALFPTGAQIVLQPSPNPGYKFDGWSGACGGTGNCLFTLNQDTTASATFSMDTTMQLILSSSGGQSRSLQAAYDAASHGSTLKLMATDFIEDFNANQTKTITIQGGYNIDFSSNVAGVSVLNGAMTITSGIVIVDRLTIR